MGTSPDAFKRSHRDSDCQAAIEREFQELAERADGLGWTGDEVDGALVALALAHIKARVGTAAVERAIKQARASVGER